MKKSLMGVKRRAKIAAVEKLRRMWDGVLAKHKEINEKVMESHSGFLFKK